ncbi:alpha/beta fold hydrolase [Streptomyces sp. NPDC054765]
MRGDGPLILVFPGATGMQIGYAPLIRLLSAQYSVAVYDRRGHGRSATTEQNPIEIRQHATDAATVVDELEMGPAHVVGSSAGATIGLEMLSQYPNRVNKLVCHEPPLAPLLDDGARWVQWYADLVDVNDKVGTRAAFDYFFAHLASNGPGEQEPITIPDSQWPEWDLYFRRELERIVAYRPEVEALKAVRERLLPVLGADSRHRWHGRAVASLSEQLGVESREVPGGHLAPVYQPLSFQETVAQLLN